MNAIYELVTGVAKCLVTEKKTCTFDELATIINIVVKTNYSGGRGTAKVVSQAYKYAEEHYDRDTAQMIAFAFTDKDGKIAF